MIRLFCAHSHAHIHIQVLISRNYRGDVDMNVIDKFLPLVSEAEDEGSAAPIIVMENVTFLYIKHNNLYSILRSHAQFDPIRLCLPLGSEPEKFLFEASFLGKKEIDVPA